MASFVSQSFGRYHQAVASTMMRVKVSGRCGERDACGDGVGLRDRQLMEKQRDTVVGDNSASSTEIQKGQCEATRLMTGETLFLVGLPPHYHALVHFWSRVTGDQYGLNMKVQCVFLRVCVGWYTSR